MNVGRAKIKVEVEGCIRCGTICSSGWSVERQIPIRIGKREDILEIYICADCKEAEKEKIKAVEMMDGEG